MTTCQRCIEFNTESSYFRFIKKFSSVVKIWITVYLNRWVYPPPPGDYLWLGKRKSVFIVSRVSRTIILRRSMRVVSHRRVCNARSGGGGEDGGLGCAGADEDGSVVRPPRPDGGERAIGGTKTRGARSSRGTFEPERAPEGLDRRPWGITRRSETARCGVRPP